jgi:hypothetical protein
MKKCIKGFDLFGHPISLYFNKSGDSHKTLLGGNVSIVIYITFVFYFYYLISKLVNFQGDNLLSVSSANTDWTRVRFNDTATFIYLIVQRASSQ